MIATPEKLALIGPVVPYRGGIAQHTTMLHRSLSGYVSLLTISFRRQYPAWLYPGGTDKDPSHLGTTEPGVIYALDSLAPWTWWQTVKVIERAGVETVVIPWWTVFWAPQVYWIGRALRRRGIGVVFVCHNVLDHEVRWWKRELAARVLGLGRAFLVHTASEKDKLRNLLGEVPVAVHPHPVMGHSPPKEVGYERRASLELLFFGLVRPYKGLDILVAALALMEKSDAHLTIAGEFWESEAELRRHLKELALEDRVEVVNRYLGEEETAEYFARSDFVVLPYRSASGSGVIPLAYRYEKPVIATRVGGLVEVVEPGRTGYLVDPENPQELAQILDSLTCVESEAMRPRIRALARTYSWEGLVEVLMALLKK